MTIRRRDLLAGGVTAGALLAGGVLVPVGIVLSEDDNPTGATGATLARYERIRIGSASALGVGDSTFFDYPWGPLRTSSSGRPSPSSAVSARTVWGGFVSFLAVGCPVCNQAVVALVGTSGALSWWAPVQPVVGLLAIALLVHALRRRLETHDLAACPVPV